MRIKTFTLNSKQEVISKIVREILNLFKVEVIGSHGEADYLQLSVVNHQLTPSADGSGRGVKVESRLLLFDKGGNKQEFCRLDEGKGDEREAAARNRLIKLNLYHIFLEHLGAEAAPWGILHGVRPTKIVHRWIRGGAGQQEIIERIQEDYACSREKADIIVPMAFRQLPFLETSDDKTVSIYVGGGTPTSLPDAFFAEMLEMVYNAFYKSDLAEFTVEAGRPDSITPEKIAAMKRFKVSRVSVNPQTMQARTLQLIGRQHTPEAVAEMFHALREAGLPHINMDLILGLPGETAEDVQDTLEKVTALEPDDITLHALAIKRGSRLKLLMEERHVELPSDEETRRMSEVALGFMERGGYQPYYLYRQGYMSGDLENIGCARPGAEGMYNIQIMEEHQTIIGIGGSATTKVVDPVTGRLRSVFNAKDLATYLRDIDVYIEKRKHLLEEIYGNASK